MFIGGLFVLAAAEFAQIAERRGRASDAAGYRAEAEKMAHVVTEHGWDGEWFRRAYDHAGRVVGSAENAEGQIFIEPQGMCVMSGIGLRNGMAVRALASVRKRLATSHGILLLQPAYTRYHRAARRSRAARRLGRVHRHPALPRRDVPDQRPQPGPDQRPGGQPGGGRSPGQGNARAAGTGRYDRACRGSRPVNAPMR